MTAKARSHSSMLSTALLGLALTFDLSACSETTDETGTADGLVGLVQPASLSEEEPLVVDVRARADYDAGHVPRARHLDPGMLRATVDGVEGQVADREAAEQAFALAGLDEATPVVVLGSDNGTDPARVAWTLRYYGYEASVALLDGGMAAYRAAGLPEDTAAPSEPGSAFSGAETQEGLRVDKAWMLENLDNADVAFFDVRTPEEFAEGHIPGAINVNWVENLDAAGRFVSAQDVRGNHGDPDADTLVVYCRTGSRASVSWALLSEAGYADVRLYDGSWAEWGSDPQTPKE